MPEDTGRAIAANAHRLSQRCQRILHKQGDATQGAVLADLLSLWLAGHIVVEEIGQAERPETDKIRAMILDEFIAVVRKLMPESEKEILRRTTAEGSA